MNIETALSAASIPDTMKQDGVLQELVRQFETRKALLEAEAAKKEKRDKENWGLAAYLLSLIENSNTPRVNFTMDSIIAHLKPNFPYINPPAVSNSLSYLHRSTDHIDVEYYWKNRSYLVTNRKLADETTYF